MASRSQRSYEYDTLTSEDYWHQYSDVILANPPFMSPKGGIRPHKRFSVQSNRSEVLFVDYIAEHLTPDGRAAVIVPEGIIFQSGNAYKQLRKMLVEKYLVGVISLPAGVFNPYSGVKTSILWLDKTLAKKTDKILFLKIENDGFDLGAQRRAIKDNDLITTIGIIKDYKGSIIEGRNTPISNDKTLFIEKTRLGVHDDYYLSFDRYVLQTKLVTDFKTVPLKELSEFNNGLWTGKKEPLIKVKVIRNTNFRRDGFIDWTDIAELDVEQNQFLYRELVKGDIVIEKSGGGPTQPVGRVVLFNKSERGFSYSNFTSRIRVKRDELMPTFLWLVLRDFYERGKTEKFQKQTSGIRNLDFNLYKEIQIPVPPLFVQNEIVAEIKSYQKIIDGARQVVENYKPRIDIDPEWEMVEFKSLAKIINGRAYKQQELLDKGTYPVLRVGNFFSNRSWYYTTLELEPNKYCVKGDLLFAWSASFGPRIWDGEKAVYHYHIWKIEPNDSKIEKMFLYYMLGIETEKIKAEGGRGIAMIHITKEGMEIRKFPLPPMNIQREIVKLLEQEKIYISANKQLIEIFEQKIKERIAKVWGE